MNKEEYMTGCQLRQYLHISTRKLKFIMEKNLIKHIDTGHVTHKYLIEKQVAEEFKYQMDNDPKFMIKY